MQKKCSPYSGDALETQLNFSKDSRMNQLKPCFKHLTTYSQLRTALINHLPPPSCKTHLFARPNHQLICWYGMRMSPVMPSSTMKCVQLFSRYNCSICVYVKSVLFLWTESSHHYLQFGTTLNISKLSNLNQLLN